MRSHRRFAPALTPALTPALALALTIGLVGCTPEPDPEPEPVADAFAADLVDGTFDGAPVADPDLAAAQLTSILGAVAELPRTVTVASLTEVESDDADAPERRIAALDWSIELDEGAEPLTFRTTTTLTLAEGTDTDAAWSVDWSPTVVHPGATADTVVTIDRTPAERADVTGRGGSRSWSIATSSGSGSTRPT
ncbi:hypothetical protein [Serinibacter arcticus]|uniref:hypothetical protein n=1 Tax=Serinibacter arcticus TaxID=1655435 RepID=UPI001F2A7094|nr:hypothetical protein [Serinibacter arcticus]